jgi:hypothetical protein
MGNNYSLIMKKPKSIIQQNQFTDFLLYKTPDGKIKVEILLRDENIWLTQKKIAELFSINVPAISKHLNNIYIEGELKRESTVSILETVRKEGTRKVKRNVEYYNLDAIIAVGYRVNSKQATHFRIWATQVLKEYIIKGFAMNDERLKDPRHVFGKDYFEEQLARIRDIRSSERRFYQKITDIYAKCSADYDSSEKITKDFFATVQNKLHFAITGQTAAELIHVRASHLKPNMGLTNWKNSPKGKIRKPDVSVAKNYLGQKELDQLNRIVTMYLDYAEFQAAEGRIMYMKDWIEKLNAFLKFNRKNILQNSGKISNDLAAAMAEKEFKTFSKNQDKNYISDFDREVEKLLKIAPD